MKKTLAIVLALAMVLCMMPAAFANTTKTITDKSYNITVASVGGTQIGSATKANSVEAKYNFETEGSDVTGKFTEDKKMALVTVTGFDTALETATNYEVTIDGKKLEVNDMAAYASEVNSAAKGTVVFPVELTKSGYSDTYLITVKGTKDSEDITETAKLTVKFVNSAAYKDAATATISEIVGTDVDAYIVGSKIYLDYPTATLTDGDSSVKFTFKDENGAKFSAVTWAYVPDSKFAANDSVFYFAGKDGVKLDGSAASFKVKAGTAATMGDIAKEIVFNLETASKIYETKKYDVVIRTNITEDDPKGIYFADSTKTIKVGESFSPVVMGVATGKVLPYRNGVGATSSLTIKLPTDTSRQVIDVDGNSVIGTQEGVAYITATYKTNIANTTYTASSMKVIVTAGAAIDPTAGTTYTVTCRVLNIRKGAGTSFAKAGKATRGTKLTVVSIDNGWAKLENGTFVCAKYLAK